MSLVDPAEVRDSFNTEASKSRKKNRPRTRPKPDQFDLQPESNDFIQQPEEVLTPDPIPASLRRRPATPQATPQVRADAVRDSNFISDEEKVAYQQDAITENIQQQAQIAQNWARLSGHPITMEEAIVRVRTNDSGLRVNPVTGVAHPQGDVYSKKPMTPKQVAEQAEREFPELTAIAKLSGLTPEEQAAAVSLPLAVDALKKIMATQNSTRQQQIMNTMGPDMQALVYDMYNAWEAEAKSNLEKRADSEETGKNLVTDLIGFAWDVAFAPILDGLIAAQETVERGVLQVGYLSGGASMEDATAATEDGAMDPEMVDYAREYFGATVVEVILEEMEAGRSSDPQKAIAELYKKYGEEGEDQDLEKLSIIEQTLSDETGALYNQNVLDAITYLNSALTDNLGNAVNWSYGASRAWHPWNQSKNINPLSPEGVKFSQSPIFTGSRDLMNVLSMFRTDPLILGSGVRKAYVLGKYGFKNMDALEIAAVFQTKGTRTFFDEVGATLRQADEAQAAGDGAKAAQIMNSARSTYKKYFTADALQALRKANVRTADEAEVFFQDAKNLEYMVAGQLAKRNNQLVIPHMTIATAMFKRASLVARKVTYDRNASKHIDEVFGEGTAAMIPEEAKKVIIKQLLEGNFASGERFIGRFFSDFVFANNKAKRTYIGKIISFVRKDNSKQRYGYQRETGLRRRAERLARPLSRVPDLSNGLIIADGSHAYKIREMAMMAGMPKYWADYASELWKVMEPGERKLFAGGLGRSAGYALGIDIVDPKKGTKLISEMVSGTRGGEMYAPAWINTVAIQGEARRTVLANNPGATPERIEELVLDEVERALKTQNIDTPASPNYLKASRFAPEGVEQEAAIYLYQMTDRIGMASFPKLSELSMRQSYLSAILGQTDAFTAATDYWTLATIGGPRFFLRNGIEDASLYALTGGSWQGFRQGQMWSKAKREATMRADRWDLPDDSKKTVGNKLGLFFTGLRYIGDVLPKSLQTIILPHLSNAEIKLAATMGRSGNREGLVSLISKAYMRRQGIGITPGVRYDKDTIRYLDEAVEDPSFFNIMDIASESPEDMLSGRLSGSVGAELSSAIINGEIKTIRGVVIPSKLESAGRLEAANSWLRSVMNIVHGDGVYGPKAISLIEGKRGYHYAVSSGDTALKNKIIKEYADFIEANLDRGMESSAIYAAEGAEGMARRKLDDGLRIFSDNNGSLNTELLGLISVTDKNGVKSYATYREEGGAFIPLVTEEKLMGLPLPYSVMSSPPVLMPISAISDIKDTKRLTQSWWSTMGRALARFTREPIFIANYIEARKFIQPIETRLSAEFGPAYAKKWAVTNGYERAFNLTMAYVDNPQIRSQMAWSVRNVSRFYRAQEDFFRRMMRVGKNNPLAIEKLNLSWHALDETGFVNENEYGEKIFTWPGNKVTINAINFFTEKALARNFLEGGALVDFTSSVTRLSPSADPQAIPYTLSGPYPSIGLPALMYFFPGLKEFNEELAGDMSVNRSWMDGAIPTTAKNAIELVNAIMGEDKFTDAEGRGADSAKSAILIYAANKPEAFDQNKSYSNSELRKLQQELNILGTDISILKSISGPTMPASVNISDEQVSSFAKSLGITGFRTVYTELIKLNDGDSNMALMQFTAKHPGQSIFAVSKNTNVNNFGNFPSTKETQKFVEENMEEFKENSSGISFFAPQDGVSNIEAWRYFRAQGATIPERVDYYFNELLTAKGYSLYRIEQNRHYDQMKLFSKAIAGMPRSGNDDAIELIKDQMSRERKIHKILNRGLYVDYEMLESRISGKLKTSSLTSKSDNESYLEDVKNALVYMEGKKDVSERTKATRKLFDGYEKALSDREIMNPNDAQATKNNNNFKTQWSTFVRSYEDMYPEDSQWESLINSMNGSLRLELI